MKVLPLAGLGHGAESAHESYPRLLQFLLPSVAVRAHRKIEIVRKEIRGPKLVSRAWVQGECKFDGDGLKCEIRLYEGLFLALRCIEEIMATRGQKKLKSSDAIAFLSSTMERFWLRPDDPLGENEFFMHEGHHWGEIKLGQESPIAKILAYLDMVMDEEQRIRCEVGVNVASLFIIAHELGHYVVRANRSSQELTSWAEATKNLFQAPEDWESDWAMSWAIELQADREAMMILTDFATRASRGEIEEIQFDIGINDALPLLLMELYDGIWHALGCVHSLEMYGWARFSKPYPSQSHPPGFRRKEWLTHIPPPDVALTLTAVPERQWVELEYLFGDLLSDLGSKGLLVLTKDQKKEALRYLRSAGSRFKKTYSRVRWRALTDFIARTSERFNEVKRRGG